MISRLLDAIARIVRDLRITVTSRLVLRPAPDL